MDKLKKFENYALSSSEMKSVLGGDLLGDCLDSADIGCQISCGNDIECYAWCVNNQALQCQALFGG